jgi:hypoxanthine-DNA glycosylase
MVAQYEIPDYFPKNEKGLPLIANEKTKILIMGSFPGKRSVISREYYSDKSNDIWKILGKVYFIDFKSMNYSEKIKNIFNNNIGVWDIYSTCQRETSRDKNIVGGSLNNFKSLKINCPTLEKICFNGKCAGRYEENFLELGYETFILPSSSGANRGNEKKELVLGNLL